MPGRPFTVPAHGQASPKDPIPTDTAAGSSGGSQRRDTDPVPIAKKDVPILVMSTVIVVAAGLAVAAAILFLLPRGETGESSGPVRIGLASSIEKQLEEGPFFQADPLGGNRSFWVALEDGEIVALVIEAPGRPGCVVDYRGRDETFVDCDGEPVATETLDRYALTVSTDEATEGALLVDLEEVEPAPAPAVTSP